MGTEEETRCLVYPGTDLYGAEGLELAGDRAVVHQSIAEICPLLPNSKEYFANGSRIYLDSNGIELTTPETRNPSQNALYIQANSELLVGGLTRYLVRRARIYNTPQTAIYPRRVRDSRGNTWGCHDNFSLSDDGFQQMTHARSSRHYRGRLWNHFLKSRNFITGAGLITPHSIHYSQKLSVPHLHSTHAYKPTLLSVRSEGRFEVRANDINIREWAVVNRIGGASLFLAAVLNPRFAHDLRKTAVFNESHDYLGTNRIFFDKKLNLVRTPGIERSISLQRTIWSKILLHLEQYSGEPIPPHLKNVAKDHLKFCDDFETVIRGKAELEFLADRADWAQKLSVAIADIRRKPEGRSITDARSQAIDQLYDRVKVTVTPAKDEVIIQRNNGFGIRKASEARTAAEIEIESAMIVPPRNTRAQKRVAKAQELGTAMLSYDWEELVYIDDDKEIPIKLPL